MPDEDDPHAWLSTTDALGEPAARLPVVPTFRLTTASATAWIESGFQKPA